MRDADSGIIVTIWFRLSDSYKEKLNCDKSKLLEQMWIRKHEEFSIEEWEEEYNTFSEVLEKKMERI